MGEYTCITDFDTEMSTGGSRLRTAQFLLSGQSITHYDETKKRAHDSQIVRVKENLKLSHGGSSYRQASGTNPPIKSLRQSCH